jgi:SAM-dependent methyltransferase
LSQGPVAWLETPSFDARQDRTRWLYGQFASVFQQGRVLDVGCYQAPMRQFVGRERYTGVDFVGDPDVELNLETCTALPFEDRSFDTVMCIEVLEHLTNLHALARDLFRVADRHVLISLPNAWRDARVKIERGHGRIAHYGLPLEPPKDRHKWFFNVTEAREFLAALAPAGWSCELSVSEPRRSPAVRAVRRLRYGPEAYANRYGQTVWALYRRG